MIAEYNSGVDMWHEYIALYGETEAKGICNRYLDMQIFNKDPEEIKFCKELYAAMQETSDRSSSKSKPSLLDNLRQNQDIIQKSGYPKTHKTAEPDL